MRLILFLVKLTLSTIPIVNLAGQLSTIPYLGTRFVAYLAVLAGVIGKSTSVKVWNFIAYPKTLIKDTDG